MNFSVCILSDITNHTKLQAEFESNTVHLVMMSRKSSFPSSSLSSPRSLESTKNNRLHKRILRDSWTPASAGVTREFN